MITYHDSGNLSAVGGRFCATANATESIHVQNWNLEPVNARIWIRDRSGSWIKSGTATDLDPGSDGSGPGCGAGGTLHIHKNAYCSNHKPMGTDKDGLGFTLEGCAKATLTTAGCSGAYFYFRVSNGQCKCATDDCAARGSYNHYNIYKVTPSTGTHARTHAREHARTHARAHESTHARTRARTHARTRARTHAPTVASDSVPTTYSHFVPGLPHILISYQGYHSASLTFSACAPSQVLVWSIPTSTAFATSLLKCHASTRRPYA